MNSVSFLPTSTAERLLTEADRHAEQALQFFPRERSLVTPGNIVELRERTRVWLRTEFIFPQLTRFQRGLLVTLYWQRQMLMGLVNVSHQDLPEALRAQTERLTRRTEHAFMDLVHQTLDLVRLDSLSAAQQVALEQEYVRVRFSE